MKSAHHSIGSFCFYQFSCTARRMDIRCNLHTGIFLPAGHIGCLLLAFCILTLHCLSIFLTDAYPMSIKLCKTVFNILTRLNRGLPRCHGLVSGFRYCSISISSMIWSNVSTGSQISNKSAIYTGNLPCFGLYCLWYCFIPRTFYHKKCLLVFVFKA